MNDIRPCGNNGKWCENCVSKGKCNYTKNQGTIDELEKIKANLEELANDEWNIQVGATKGLKCAIEVIEDRISELKGNDTQKSEPDDFHEYWDEMAISELSGDNKQSRCNNCKNNTDELSGECYECVKGIEDWYEPISELKGENK